MALESKLKTKTMNNEIVFRYLKNQTSTVLSHVFIFILNSIICGLLGGKAIILQDLILVPKI